MLKFRDGEQRPDNDELVLFWTSPPSTRCVLVGRKNAIDLQLVRDGVVIRRTADVDPRFAREVARQWRVEYELAQDRAGAPGAALCPECGDDSVATYAGSRGGDRRSCRSCGHDWSVTPGRAS